MASPSLQPVSEKRSNHRYPVSVALEYRAVLPNQGVLIGAGLVVNMSSSGVLFQTAEFLPRGVTIELYIAWPTKLNDTVALNLYVMGRVVRMQGNYAAVRIRRSEFRIRGKRASAEKPRISLLHRVS